MNKSKSNLLSKKIREHCLNMSFNAKSSHLGSALSIADIIAVLYSDILSVNYKMSKNRDRFILSKGHACTAVYAALAEKNFISKKKLLEYGKNFSILSQHINHKVNGVEFSTGSLGHGLSFGIGKSLYALEEKKSWKVYVLISDGEMNEGSLWEALLFINHHKLNNLIIILDYNKLQSLDTTENTLKLEPLEDKLKSFGFKTIVIDGHNHNQIKKSLKEKSNKPKFIIANTVKGKGVSFMENKVEWHYKSPDYNQLIKALEEVIHK
ncbi:transketolase [Alphaproteobacteria bacterium]|nr:transketolase [Alphaproteobacteria bacterium]